MESLGYLVLPLTVWLAVSGLIAGCSIGFVSRQRERGFTMLTARKVSLFAVAAAAVATAASLLTGGLTWQTAPLVAVAAALLFLFAVTVVTDFSIFKIPTETAWLPAVVGMPAGFVYLVTVGGFALTLDRLFVVIVLAVLPIVAFVSLMFSGGGAADYRVAMSGYLATAWWISAETLFFGLLAFLALTIIGRFCFSTVSDTGRRMTPAGPAYVSLFATSAILTLSLYI